MKEIKLVILLLIFISLITNASAYQDCNGQYSSTPVFCKGGAGSGYSADSGSESTPFASYSLLEIVWTIAGILAIIYFAKKLFFRRSWHR